MPTFSVYSRRPTPVREPQPGELALMRADRWQHRPDIEVIYQERGVMLVRRRATSGAQE